MTFTNNLYRSTFIVLASACLATAACDDPDMYGDDPDAAIDEEDPEALLPDEQPGSEVPTIDELQRDPPVSATARYPCRILPLGDSITWGHNGNSTQEMSSVYWGGYRAHLVAGFTAVPSAAVGPVLMVGAMPWHSTPAQDAAFQSSHSGYPGYTSAQLAVAVDISGVTNFSPDVILLHTGTNDMIRYPGPNQHLTALGNLNTLLNLLAVKNPSAKILLAKILPMGPVYDTEVNLYNAQLDAIGAARRLAGEQVWIVDHNYLFPTASLPDGIHPDWAGYQQMAGRWRLALDALGC